MNLRILKPRGFYIQCQHGTPKYDIFLLSRFIFERKHLPNSLKVLTVLIFPGTWTLIDCKTITPHSYMFDGLCHACL